MYPRALHPAPGLPGRDPVTGLPNRALLLEALHPILALARRHDRPLAILHVCLVERGAAGAVGGIAPLLRESADALRDLIRDCDLLARVSGDTFVVAIPEVREPDAAVRLAYRMQQALRSLHGTAAPIGVAFFPADGADADALLAAAEGATPAAGSIGFADPRLGRDTLCRAELLRELEASTAMAQFELHYQPIRSLATGAVIGAEALLRWSRSGELLPAADFIGLAAGTGRLRAIDRWSIERALRDLAEWRRNGWEGWMSINLSARSLTDPSLTSLVRRLVDTLDAPARALVFEITEAGALAGNGVAAGLLEELREMGARVAVDDFGTGYASFEYLRDFDPDMVKLDRAFVVGDQDVARSDRLLRALVELAHRLEKPVVLEGVEDAVQLQGAVGSACEMAQGFFLGRPLPSRGFVERHVQPADTRRWRPRPATVPLGA